MTRPERPVVEAEDLRRGLRLAAGIFIDEAVLDRAVGESGALTLSVKFYLERGRPRWSKGGVSFERRIDMASNGGGRRSS